MVGSEPGRPGREALGDRGANRHAGLQLHRMALAVVKAHGLDALIVLERPGQADAGILPAGEQHQRAGLANWVAHRPHMRDRMADRKAAPQANLPVSGVT